MSTIRDVAKLADVSVATVSRVLNHDTKYKMTDETKERVLKAVVELDYKIPLGRQKGSFSTVEKSAKKVGCILSVIKSKFNDPYYLSILSGIEEELLKSHIEMSFVKSIPELEEKGALEEIFSEDYDGLIIMDGLPDDMYAYVKKRVGHIVGIDTLRIDIDNICYDHFQVARNAVEYLISKGYKNIGFIGGGTVEDGLRKSRRFQGYESMMRENGLHVNEDWCINSLWDSEVCMEEVDRLCKAKNLPDAFFVASDLMAMAALSSLYNNKISVPSEIAVMGMSNIEVSKFSTPPLTTISVPTEEIGKLAAECLLRRLSGFTSLPLRVILPTTLIERKSV